MSLIIILSSNYSLDIPIPVYQTGKLEFGGITMLIDFNEIKEITIPGMNNGTGTMAARMYMDEQGKNALNFG